MASQRRAPGEGKIETVTRKDGTKRHRCVLTVDGKKTVGPWCKKRTDAVPEAKRKAAGDQRSLSFAEEWSRALLSLKAEGTNREQYRMTFEHFARTALGELATPAIVAQDVQRALETHPGGPQTIRGHRTRILATLRRLGNKLEMANPRVPKKPKLVVRPDDAGEFVKFCLSLAEADALLLLVPFQLGLRRSESLGLRHSDRDGDGVWIRRKVTVTEEAVEESDVLKTENSYGWQPLSDELKKLVGSKPGYVIGGKDVPMSPSTATKRTRDLLEKTKWKGFTPQALRRSFGQFIYEQTGDIYGTAMLMRHTVQMSEREYLQTDKRLRSAVFDKAHSTAKGTAQSGKKRQSGSK